MAIHFHTSVLHFSTSFPSFGIIALLGVQRQLRLIFYIAVAAFLEPVLQPFSYEIYYTSM
jgi:hypothetical protein